MITLQNVHLIDLQPEFLKKDASTIAICAAFQPVFTALSEQLKAVLIYTNIENLPNATLDALAWGLKMNWYRLDDALEVKRKNIKNALNIYRKMGTASAVKEAVSARFGDAEVREWFEIDGSPATFEILIHSSEPSATQIAELVDTVSKVKNVRSHLSRVALINRSPSSLKIATINKIKSKIRSEQNVSI